MNDSNLTKKYLLEIKNLNKSIDGNEVLKNIDISVMEDEFFSILGPSGSGKTTLLRIIAGFETPDSGSIKIRGQDITNLPVGKRPINTVFQDYALFPNMTVWDNIAFGLRMQKENEQTIQESVRDILIMLEMHEHNNKYPGQLSGGQQQRVAIARALVKKPSILLLDEPLSALDYRMHQKTLFDLQRIQDELGVSFIFITHDQQDAITVSDRIAVLRNGSIEQIGSPGDLYERPLNGFIASFVGDNNIIEIDGNNIKAKDNEIYSSNIINKKNINIEFSSSIASGSLKNKSFVFIRPEKVQITLNEKDIPGDIKNKFYGQIVEDGYRGSYTKLTVETDVGNITTVQFITFGGSYKLGDYAWIFWDPGNSFLVYGD